MEVNVEDALIKKQVLSPGSRYIPMQDGTRVRFHFRTRKVIDGKILDDSRKMNRPMELVLGKKFKLEVWETMIQKMSLNEVAKFIVDKSLVVQYPFISQTMRDYGKQRRHCCGMTVKTEGIGYTDLDELFVNPSDLEFVFELLSIESPDDYKKDRWQMTDEEKLKASSTLREKGNKFYKEKDYNQAQECYREAVGMVETLMLKEKPHDIEWLELAAIKAPILLNYAQCRLIDGDYYAVIEDCTEVLKLQPDNVKAYFRRGKAHFGAWNPTEARKDFQKVIELDPSLERLVAKELKAIDNEQLRHDMEDKLKLQNLF